MIALHVYLDATVISHTVAVGAAANRTPISIAAPAFVDWAQDNAPHALTYKPKVSGLKGMDRADDGYLVDPNTGELVPGGVEITADPTYSVKPTPAEPEPF
jgi:hypothetical protein